MKVLLVCMSGITTNVLANKLQQYAKNNQIADIFIPCKIGMFNDMLSDTDIILLAPQARFCSKNLKDSAEIFHIPVIELTEEMFVFSKIEEIYTYINASRKESKQIIPDEKLNIRTIKKIIMQSLLRCTPIFMIGCIALILFSITRFSSFTILMKVCLNLFCLYFMFSIGHEYGVWAKTGGLSNGLISMIAPLIMMPTANVTHLSTPFIRLSDGYIPIQGFGLYPSLLLLLLTIITILILDKMKHFHINRYGVVGTITQSFIELPIRYGMIFILFLILRCFISFVI